MTKINAYMSKNVIIGKPEDTIQEIAQRMTKHNIGSVIIKDADNSLAGIVTERDMVRKIVSKGIDPSKTKIEKIMTKDVITGDPDMTVVKVATLMNHHDIKKLPLVQDGKLIGITTQTDILKILSYK